MISSVGYDKFGGYAVVNFGQLATNLRKSILILTYIKGNEGVTCHAILPQSWSISPTESGFRAISAFTSVTSYFRSRFFLGQENVKMFNVFLAFSNTVAYL